MTAALAIPHFSFCDEINVTRLIDVRNRLKPLAMVSYNIMLGVIDFNH